MISRMRELPRIGAAVRLVTAGLSAILVIAAGSLQAQPERAEASPEAAIERLHAALVDTAEEHGDAPVEARYDALEPEIAATHDLPYIAELTIRREWAGLTEDERQRFLDAFVRLSVTTYASRFASLEEGMFEIGGSDPLSGGRARVTATLTTPAGQSIPFEYVLHEADGGWKIVNILADNVSDLALKRAEYRRLLDAGSIDDVIAALERQAAEAAGGD